MKTLATLFVVVLLAGCGAVPPNAELDALREPEYLRAEQTLPQGFPQIQGALFKHKAACGTDMEFTVDPQQPSYAWITQKLSGDDGAQRLVLIDLVFQKNMTVKARAYTYYVGLDDDITRIFNAITHPDVCD